MIMSSSGSASLYRYLSRRTGPVLAERWGDDFAAAVMSDADLEYPQIAARVPDIGGRRNVFTPVMMIVGWLMALHVAMKRHGKSAEDTVTVAFTVSDRQIRALPSWLLRLIGKLAFSAPSRRMFRKQAARSKNREYAADFVYDVEERSDGEMSLVFSECAVNKHFDAEGMTDLKPYCNFFDVTYSRLMDMGVDAHETIGLGCDRCALRFKHGRETVVPDALSAVIRGGEPASSAKSS